MAELTTCRNDVLGYPVYGLPYVVVAPILDADGDPVTGATPDTEISKNGDTSADTASEAAEIAATTAANKGNYALPLSAAEMTCEVAAIMMASDTGKATPIVLYPRKLPLLASGTAGADGNDATHIDLHGLSAIDDFYNGCLVFLKDHTGANQVRLITDYAGATALATVSVGFVVTPDNTTDYEVYLTDHALPTLLTNLTWDVVRASHATAGTFGEVSTAAQLIADLLDHAIAAHSGAGTVGKTLIDILADTGELQADWVNAGRLDAILDIIAADTTTDIPTLIAALNNLSAAQANAEVVDALSTDAQAEPGQGNPAANAALSAKINYIYKWLRNKKTNDGTTVSLFNDDTTTVGQKRAVSEAAGTVTEGEIGTGA